MCNHTYIYIHAYIIRKIKESNWLNVRYRLTLTVHKAPYFYMLLYIYTICTHTGIHIHTNKHRIGKVGARKHHLPSLFTHKSRTMSIYLIENQILKPQTVQNYEYVT